MKIVTFIGNSTYLHQVLRKNRITDIYIDRSYTYRLGKKWEGVQDGMLPEDTVFLDSSEIEKLSERLKQYGIHVVVTDTGVKYLDGMNDMYMFMKREVVNRRLRIATMIVKILEDIKEDILFVDSDVILNENVIGEIVYALNNFTSPTPFSICIPALMKPSTTFVFTFCYSTNFYLPLELHDKLYDEMKLYIEKGKYFLYPVDLYIHNYVLGTKYTINTNGICHYIRGSLYCT